MMLLLIGRRGAACYVLGAARPRAGVSALRLGVRLLDGARRAASLAVEGAPSTTTGETAGTGMATPGIGTLLLLRE